MGTKIKIDYQIDKNLKPIHLDEGQFTQLINNLLINARQAMEGGGTIYISAENYMMSQNKPILKKGHYVKITVRDEGVGIAEDVIPRIFDPYFTTKPQGGGLGLFNSYFIVSKAGGHIIPDSRLGVGTVFEVFLPVSQQLIGDNSIESGNMNHKYNRILLMDDDELILKSSVKILNHLGYEVDTVQSGEDCLNLYRENFDSDRGYDLVILDLSIPHGMGGKDCVRGLLDINKDLKAIISSGDWDDPVVENFGDYGFKGALAKPYKITELKDLLDSVIG